MTQCAARQAIFINNPRKFHARNRWQISRSGRQVACAPVEIIDRKVRPIPNDPRGGQYSTMKQRECGLLHDMGLMQTGEAGGRRIDAFRRPFWIGPTLAARVVGCQASCGK